MDDQPRVSVRSARAADSAWVQEQLIASWGSTTMVSHGQAYDATQLPTLVAAQADALLGLATLRFDQDECELLTIEALQKQAGVGSALLDAVIEQANSHGCTRLWLITTNDNLDAIRFYQRRGMRLVAVHPGAVDRARKLKPSIPEAGEYGIPLHDELEFELRLEPSPLSRLEPQSQAARSVGRSD